MDTISISKFKASCSAVLDQVKESGEPIVVTRQGVPLVQLLPASEEAAEAAPGRGEAAEEATAPRRRQRSRQEEAPAPRRSPAPGRRDEAEEPQRERRSRRRQDHEDHEEDLRRRDAAEEPQRERRSRRREDDGAPPAPEATSPRREAPRRLEAEERWRQPDAPPAPSPARQGSPREAVAQTPVHEPVSGAPADGEPRAGAGRREPPPAAAEPAVAPSPRPAAESAPEAAPAAAPGAAPAAAPAAEPRPPAGGRPARKPAAEKRPRRLRRAEGGRRSRPSDEPAPRHRIQAIPQHPVETIEGTFDELGLSQPILDVLRRVGFVHPTPIQAQVLPPALEGRDIIGLAQTGSGKTAAFCLPLAERFYHGRGTRGLILSPTREIALQTKAFLDLFGEDHGLDTVCLIGGVRMGPQIRGLKNQPDLVVATPGRLLDHLRRRNVHLDKLEELVLDEADHMLDLGFLPQITELLEYVPQERRTMMFSATMPEDIKRLTNRLMADPVRIDLTPKGRAAEGIDHRLYLVEPDDKKPALLALLHLELGSTLVFIRRKIDAEWLARVLEREGHPVERIHSDLSQRHRLDALAGFREGEHRILVATDVAARGLDIPRIQHIVNFDLPDNVDDYIHRAGRTARGSLKGVVSSIATWQDKVMIRDIEAALDEELPRCTLPGVEPYEEHKPRRSMSRRGKLKVRRRL